MSCETVCFRCGDARFEIRLDGFTDLSAPKIRKLFSLMLQEPWNNQAAIDAVAAFLPVQVRRAKEDWKRAAIEFKDGWRLVQDKKSKQGRAVMAQNNRLHKAVKSTKGIYQHWERIYGYWNDTKLKMK